MAKKIFCVPYAGGNATIFNRLTVYWKDRIKLMAYEYPGHGLRIKEKYALSIEQLGRECASFIKENIESNDEIYVLGYSMGSLVAYEAICILEEEMNIDVKYLFAAANQAPCKKGILFEELGDEELLEQNILELGGFDERLASNTRYMKMILPILKSDFLLLCDYRKRVHTKKIRTDVVVLGGLQDYRHRDLDEWKEQTYGKYSHRDFDAGHFFIQDATEELVACLNEYIF